MYFSRILSKVSFDVYDIANSNARRIVLWVIFMDFTINGCCLRVVKE